MKNIPLVELESVVCNFKVKQGLLRYKSYPVLKGINLTIHEGETIGVIGRNGAGKSSLLRVIAGIIKPDKGRLDYSRPLRSLLLHLQMGFDLELSGRYNAILSSMLIGFSRKQALEKIDSIFEYAELEHVVDEPLKTYSTGMRARLGFSISMLMSPGILLIDEIFGVGDQDFRKKSVQSMKEKLSSNQTAVVVSHNMSLIRQICNRVVWVEDGQTIMEGETNTIIDAYEKPLNQDTSINISH